MVLTDTVAQAVMDSQVVSMFRKGKWGSANKQGTWEWVYTAATPIAQAFKANPYAQIVGSFSVSQSDNIASIPASWEIRADGSVACWILTPPNTRLGMGDKFNSYSSRLGGKVGQ